MKNPIKQCRFWTHYLFSRPSLPFPRFYYMIGANLGCFSHGAVSVMLILKNEISFKSVDHKNKILLIFTFQKTAIAIPFQGKFEIP